MKNIRYKHLKSEFHAVIKINLNIGRKIAEHEINILLKFYIKMRIYSRYFQTQSLRKPNYKISIKFQ